MSGESRRPFAARPAPVIGMRTAAQDCLFLVLLLTFSIVTYVRGLGFYVDDWTVVGILTNSDDSSLIGLLRTLGLAQPFILVRPVQWLYYTGLYLLFGLHPLGYHLVNAAVLAAVIVLLYLVLREIGQSRVLSLAIPMIYASLPHYSTARFVFDAFKSNLSMLFFLLSVILELRAVRSDGARWWFGKLLGTGCALMSVLAYEVALPLFFLSQALVLDRARQRRSQVPGERVPRLTYRMLLWSTPLALAPAIAYKVLLSDRIGIIGGYVNWALSIARGAVGINYIRYGAQLPVKVLGILRNFPDGRILLMSVLAGGLAAGYLYRAIAQTEAETIERRDWLVMTGLGFLVFGLGYAIFLTSQAVGFTTTGINNRTAFAAALGVAISFVGACGWVSWVPSAFRLRQVLFTGVIALLTASGFLIVNTIGRFWVAAARRQAEVIADVHGQFPTLPAETTLFLDGVCPYIGPGVVFDCGWDVTGMLRTTYHDATLRGDIVRAAMNVDERGLTTPIPGKLNAYGDRILLYNLARKQTLKLTDFESARRYFEAFNPDYSGGCPDGNYGRGVWVW